jgi:glycerol kinase
MAQDLADMLGISVERPDFVETTALGAAMLAAVGAEIYPSLEACAGMRGGITRFSPQLDAAERGKRLSGWQAAVETVTRP